MNLFTYFFNENISRSGGENKGIHVSKLSIVYTIFISMGKLRDDILTKREEIESWISDDLSKAYICRQLKCKPETLERYLGLMGIEYNGNQGMKGKKTDPKRKTALEYINSGSHIKTNLLKKKLWEDGVKKRCCEICGITKWNNQPAPLQLHHIDGNRYNNDFDNLQILCANCHCQTDNHSGKKTHA